MISLNSLGINTGVIVAIVSLSEVLKSFDKTKKFKKIYTLIPFLFSIIFALVTITPISFSGIIYKALLLFGASSFSYNIIKKSIGESGSWKLTKQSSIKDNDNDKG